MSDTGAFAVVILVALLCILLGCVIGDSTRQRYIEENLISKEICEYKVDSKTGKTSLVIIATGKPFYGEDK
jgi:hypothetical protein